MSAVKSIVKVTTASVTAATKTAVTETARITKDVGLDINGALFYLDSIERCYEKYRGKVKDKAHFALQFALQLQSVEWYLQEDLKRSEVIREKVKGLQEKVMENAGSAPPKLRVGDAYPIMKMTLELQKAWKHAIKLSNTNRWKIAVAGVSRVYASMLV